MVQEQFQTTLTSPAPTSPTGEKIYLASTDTVSDATPRYQLSDQDLAFLRSLRPGLSLPELKAHVLNCYARGMRSEGMKYRCFQSQYHLLPAVTDNPVYPSLLARPSKGLWLDLGGGQGTDARKLIQDGWPAEQIVVSDINSFLWTVGLDLFQDGPKGPVRFVEGNLLNAADVEPGGALHSLIGKSDVVHAQALLHLFNEGTFKAYINAAKPFLKPGGLFIGGNAGSTRPGPLARPTGEDPSLSPWLYDPAGFKALLEEAGFADVRVEPGEFRDFLRRRGFGEPVWNAADIPNILGDGRELLWMTWSAELSSQAS